MNTNIYRTIIIKIGTNVLTQENGLPNLPIMKQLVDQIAELNKNNVLVILVSSGAVAYGQSLISIKDKYDPVARRQQLAAVGQVELIHSYKEMLKEHSLHCAQVLVTKGDFRDRMHYLNMKNCINNLLDSHIIPIVNENDVISVTELMFTDNDELTGLLASMVDADAVLLLTNVEGLYDGDPKDGNSKIIKVIEPSQADLSSIVEAGVSHFGRGGMITKAKMALKLSKMGITVHIADGRKKDIILQLCSGTQEGSYFKPHKNTSDVKRWVAHSEGFAKGTVTINQGAEEALLIQEKTTSLLPVGIIKINGSFNKGEIIKIINESGKFVGLGMAAYSSEIATQNIGKRKKKPLVHYDYLYLDPAPYDETDKWING